MNIYILPVSGNVQPSSQPFPYPPHNSDYGVEQDFLIWLNKNQQLLTNDPAMADWHYLPVFWTRWILNNEFGKNTAKIEALQKVINSCLLDDKKTFTICQNDDGPMVNLGNAKVFLASRKDKSGIDIPLLCSAHNMPIIKPAKKYIACFNGNFDTHPIRKQIREIYGRCSEFKIGSPEPQRFWNRVLKGPKFIENIRSSYLSLAPRGYGGSSFRFFESMQLGTAPVLIGNYDTRPFKKFIDWENISYFVSDIDEFEKLVRNLDKEEALERGMKAKKCLEEELYYQKWCKYVILELQNENQ